MKFGVQIDVSGSPIWIENGHSHILATRSRADRERLVKAALIRVLKRFDIEVNGVMELDDEQPRTGAVEPINGGTPIRRTAGHKP